MPLNVVTTPAVGESGYTYVVNTDLDLQWGKVNVDKWADADNDKDAAKILARRAWALARAERYINSRLQGSIYSIPFAAVPDTPTEIRDLVVTYAGLYLYQSPRGLVDGDDTNDAMQQIKDDAEIIIRNIIAGVYRINATLAFSGHPAVVRIDEIPAEKPIVVQS